jgi:hypothetical protein
MGNILHTLLRSNLLKNLTQVRDIVDQALDTAVHVLWVVVATTLDSMPKALNLECILKCHTNYRFGDDSSVLLTVCQ